MRFPSEGDVGRAAEAICAAREAGDFPPGREVPSAGVAPCEEGRAAVAAGDLPPRRPATFAGLLPVRTFPAVDAGVNSSAGRAVSELWPGMVLPPFLDVRGVFIAFFPMVMMNCDEYREEEEGESGNREREIVGRRKEGGTPRVVPEKGDKEEKEKD